MDEETIMADREEDERGTTFARAKLAVLEMACDAGWPPSEDNFHQWILSLPRTATSSEADDTDDTPF